MLRAISDKSALIAEAAAKGEPGRFETGANAKEWVMRRTGGLRYNNYKVRVDQGCEHLVIGDNADRLRVCRVRAVGTVGKGRKTRLSPRR